MLAFSTGLIGRAQLTSLRHGAGSDPGDAALHYYRRSPPRTWIAVTTRDPANSGDPRELSRRISPEAVDARRWLTEAGVPACPAETSVRRGPHHRGDARRQRSVGTGRGGRAARQRACSSSSRARRRARTRELHGCCGRTTAACFEFAIPPGTYMLTRQVAGERTWRSRVRLRAWRNHRSI